MWASEHASIDPDISACQGLYGGMRRWPRPSPRTRCSPLSSATPPRFSPRSHVLRHPLGARLAREVPPCIARSSSLAGAAEGRGHSQAFATLGRVPGRDARSLGMVERSTSSARAATSVTAVARVRRGTPRALPSAARQHRVTSRPAEHSGRGSRGASPDRERIGTERALGVTPRSDDARALTCRSVCRSGRGRRRSPLRRRGTWCRRPLERDFVARRSRTNRGRLYGTASPATVTRASDGRRSLDRRVDLYGARDHVRRLAEFRHESARFAAVEKARSWCRRPLGGSSPSALTDVAGFVAEVVGGRLHGMPTPAFAMLQVKAAAAAGRRHPLFGCATMSPTRTRSSGCCSGSEGLRAARMAMSCPPVGRASHTCSGCRRDEQDELRSRRIGLSAARIPAMRWHVRSGFHFVPGDSDGFCRPSRWGRGC